jgi:hypothetical protein
MNRAATDRTRTSVQKMETAVSHTEKIAGKHNLSGLVMEIPKGREKEEDKKNTRRRELETKIKRTGGMSWKGFREDDLG